MTVEDGDHRKLWKEISPELKSALGSLAFTPAGEALTPRLREVLQHEVIEDFLDEEEGEQ